MVVCLEVCAYVASVIDCVKGLLLLCRHVVQVCKAFNLEGRMSICQMPPSLHSSSIPTLLYRPPAADSLWRAQQQQQQRWQRRWRRGDGRWGKGGKGGGGGGGSTDRSICRVVCTDGCGVVSASRACVWVIGMIITDRLDDPPPHTYTHDTKKKTTQTVDYIFVSHPTCFAYI